MGPVYGRSSKINSVAAVFLPSFLPSFTVPCSLVFPCRNHIPHPHTHTHFEALIRNFNYKTRPHRPELPELTGLLGQTSGQKEVYPVPILTMNPFRPPVGPIIKERYDKRERDKEKREGGGGRRGGLYLEREGAAW